LCGMGGCDLLHGKLPRLVVCKIFPFPFVVAMDLQTLDHQVALRALATALERICNVNCDLRCNSPTAFDAVAVPTMTIHAYLVRLHRYTKFDFACFHVAMWYLGRLCQHSPAYCPTMHNVHRLLVASLLVASKATDDVFHANLFMAQCGGITVGELNKLERDLCEKLNWRLLPTVSEMRALLEAVGNPNAPFWLSWHNLPQVQPASPALARGDGSAASGDAAARMPHAKSVQHSLSRFFAGGACSEGNLEALGTSAAKAAPTSSMPSAAADGEAHATDNNSPRTVLNRNFSLSNLFGLAAGW